MSGETITLPGSLICESLRLPWADTFRAFANRVTVTQDWITTADGHRSHAMPNVDALEPGQYLWASDGTITRESNSDVYAIDRIINVFDASSSFDVLRRPDLETQIATATKCTALIPLADRVRVQYRGTRKTGKVWSYTKKPKEWTFQTFGYGQPAERDTVHIDAQYLWEAMQFLGILGAIARFSDRESPVKIENEDGSVVVIMPVRT